MYKCTKYNFNKLKSINIVKYCKNKTKVQCIKLKVRLITSIKKIKKLDSLYSLALFGLKVTLGLCWVNLHDIT